jgi:enoyl-CoA hydratase
MADGDVVHVDLTDHVLTMTMDRPEARNALGRQMVAELTAAFRRLDDDADIWAGILQAEGPTFCAGADLKEALEDRTSSRRAKEGDGAERGGAGGEGRRSGGRKPFRPPMMQRHRKPVVACVEGHAYAGGMEILLACDLVVATTGARFALTEVKRGLLAVGGGLFRLPRRIPHNIAMEMLLTGEAKTAEVMHHHGFVNRLTAPGEARTAARALAEQLTANGPVAVQAALEVAGLAASEGWTEDEAWERQMEALHRVQRSEDLTEGLRAFAEKRPPQWKGR